MVSSVARYLLSKEKLTSEQRVLVKEILNYLADLINHDPTIYAEYMPNEKLRKKFPSGYINLGVAHGILGPLYVLALGFKKFDMTQYLLSIEKGLSYYERSFLRIRLVKLLVGMVESVMLWRMRDLDLIQVGVMAVLG